MPKSRKSVETRKSNRAAAKRNTHNAAHPNDLEPKGAKTGTVSRQGQPIPGRKPVKP